MIDMLKRHEIQVLRRAGHTLAEIASISGASVGSVRRVIAEPAVQDVDSDAERERRRIGRPAKADAFRTVMTQALAEDADLRSVELLRRARLGGYTGGKSALYELIRTLRPRPVRPLVRFDGLPGEFSQHDFGEVMVGFLNGTEARVHFFASRLKYSRWVEVSLVPDQRVETLVRTLVDHFAAIGGVPLVAVFDRPKTVALKWGRDGAVTEWNPTFAAVTLDLSVGVDVCWPGRPQEKGAIENVVGWVKGSFFKQRRFLDHDDLAQQLRVWLEEINRVRPCRATGVPPLVRLAEERPRLRPLKITPADLALRIPVSVTPTGDVLHDTHTYSMPPDAIGLPGTLYLYRDRVRIVAGRFSAEHPRLWQADERSTLPEHRAQAVAAVSGKRARRYLQRQHLLELGAAAHAYLTELIHRRPRTWVPEVERLHQLLEIHGEQSLRAAFARGLAEQAIGAEYIAHYVTAAVEPPLPLDPKSRPSTLSASLTATARRPGPGRRRRPEGRSEAEPLDAAEHGGNLF
jgi:transposase